MAQTNINIRIDANRKKEFEEFCEAVGLTMTAAFNIFIQRTLRDYRIPFDIGAEMPNAETKEAIKEVQRMKSDPVRGKTYTDVDTMMKDLKRMHRRGYDISLLTEIIRKLSEGKALPEKNKDHSLSGDYIGCRECHITPDWLLIYEIYDRELILYLTRTGSHSDLF